MTSTSQPATVIGMVVQLYRADLSEWRKINDRILVRDYLKPGISHEAAVAAARREGERQVTGWSNAYPTKEYRLRAALADGSLGNP